MKIAVIPARGGSKRIPRKNIKDFCGKPMISWSIEAAKECGLFDHIFVSTDDQEIAEISESYGASVPFIRPNNLSDDFTSTSDVVEHAYKWCEKNIGHIDYVCCIYATAPFIRSVDIKNCFLEMVETGANIAFTATTFPFPIQRAIKLNSSYRVEMFQPQHLMTRSQDLESAYHDAGQIYWSSDMAVKSGMSAFSKDATVFILPRYRVQDIDTIEDWEYAEYLFKVINQGDSNIYNK
jgi:pseudaminic acid cytidylyltransferase